MLADRGVPSDDELPDSGIGVEMERLLGSRFIVSPVYGTRGSYVVLVGRDDRITLVEQTFDRGRPAGEPICFEFGVSPR